MCESYIKFVLLEFVSLENSGVIVLINIICAIVFAAQVEDDGQWNVAI